MRQTLLMNSKEIYTGRINKAIEYIENHIDEPLSLSDIASQACFSPFHFHRIFSLLTSETLYGFINRLRLEKSLAILVSAESPAIKDIAYLCGFSSQAVFARAFKKHFGMTALEYRKNWPEVRKRNIRKNSKIDPDIQPYFWNFEPYKKWKVMIEQCISVKHMPKLNLIYCLHTGPYHLIGESYGRLMSWAGRKGLLNPGVKTVTVYHDDPTITKIENLRQYACITAPKTAMVEGEFNHTSVPEGLYAVGSFEIDVNEFEEAWNAVCAWLMNSGYQPKIGFPYELYHNNHEEHPQKKFILDICIPVKELTLND